MVSMNGLDSNLLQWSSLPERFVILKAMLTGFTFQVLSPIQQKLPGAIRSYWVIEISLHCVLDVTFDEDRKPLKPVLCCAVACRSKSIKKYSKAVSKRGYLNVVCQTSISRKS